MSTHATIEQILHDLYTLDRSLEERDGEIRVIVTKLFEGKPNIAPDSLFVETLRARLIPTNPSTFHVVTRSTRWWMVHLVPVGMLAILTLILVPQVFPVHTEINSLMLPPESSSEIFISPDVKRAAPREEAVPALMNSMALDVPEQNLIVETQTPGEMVIIKMLSVETSGFVVIQKNEADVSSDILGVSAFLSPGVYEQFDVPLMQSTEVGGTYSATFVPDNGDGIWEREEYSFEDPGILSVPFSVLSQPL